MTTDRETTGEETTGEETTATLLRRVGGAVGLVCSVAPVIVFAVVAALLPLPAALVASIVVGLLLAAVRVRRGERVRSAVAGLLAVGLAAGVVAWTGAPKDFFVVEIWASLAGFVVLAGSVAARRPATGSAWNRLHGGTRAWRHDRVVLRAHDLATLGVALVLGARFVVNQWLYVADSTAGLAIAQIAMGPPLTLLTVIVVVRAFRCSTRRLLTPPTTAVRGS